MHDFNALLLQLIKFSMRRSEVNNKLSANLVEEIQDLDIKMPNDQKVKLSEKEIKYLRTPNFLKKYFKSV